MSVLDNLQDEKIHKINSNLYPNEINVTNDEWLVGYVVYGGGLIIPLQIPYGYNANVTSVEIFALGNNWVDVTYAKYEESYSRRQIKCAYEAIGNQNAGYPVLCRMVATFTKK